MVFETEVGPDGTSDQLAATSPVAVRLGGFLFVSGTAITIIAVVVPHPATVNTTGLWYLAGAEALVALLLVGAGASGRRPGRWFPVLTIITAIAAVTAGVYLNGERVGGPTVLNEFFFVWPAVYGSYFYSKQTTVLIVLGIALAYIAVSINIGVSGDTLMVRTLMMMSVVAGSAGFVHILRLQVDSLVLRADRLARTDSLTSLLNRRGFDERMELEMARSARQQRPLTVMLGDIDRFKRINDRFGHATGDEILAQIGAVLGTSTRPEDAAARLGGEEFAFLFPDSDPEKARLAAARLRRDISRIQAPDGRTITLSFGIATSQGSPGRTSAELLAAADAALYEAKERGRDRTVVAATPSSLRPAVSPSKLKTVS